MSALSIPCQHGTGLRGRRCAGRWHRDGLDRTQKPHFAAQAWRDASAFVEKVRAIWVSGPGSMAATMRAM